MSLLLSTATVSVCHVVHTIHCFRVTTNSGFIQGMCGSRTVGTTGTGGNRTMGTHLAPRRS